MAKNRPEIKADIDALTAIHTESDYKNTLKEILTQNFVTTKDNGVSRTKSVDGTTIDFSDVSGEVIDYIEYTDDGTINTEVTITGIATGNVKYLKVNKPFNRYFKFTNTIGGRAKDNVRFYTSFTCAVYSKDGSNIIIDILDNSGLASNIISSGGLDFTSGFLSGITDFDIAIEIAAGVTVEGLSVDDFPNTAGALVHIQSAENGEVFNISVNDFGEDDLITYQGRGEINEGSTASINFVNKSHSKIQEVTVGSDAELFFKKTNGVVTLMISLSGNITTYQNTTITIPSQMRPTVFPPSAAIEIGNSYITPAGQEVGAFLHIDPDLGNFGVFDYKNEDTYLNWLQFTYIANFK